MADGYACYRPAGQVTFEEASAMVRRAIAFARDHQVRKLLVDGTNLRGIKKPDTYDRFQMAEQWAAVAKSSVIVGLVVKAELIDERRFGMTVARNRAFLANVFTSEAEALSWLLAQ